MDNCWDMLDFDSCQGTTQKIMKAWNYFNAEYAQKEIKDYRGQKVTGFTEERFKHVISGSTDFRTVYIHDVPFVDERAERIPWINPTLTASDCEVEVRKETRRDSRNRRRKSRLYLVVEKQFVVVLEEDKTALRFRTAYPVTANKISTKLSKYMLLDKVKA